MTCVLYLGVNVKSSCFSWSQHYKDGGTICFWKKTRNIQATAYLTYWYLFISLYGDHVHTRPKNRMRVPVPLTTAQQLMRLLTPPTQWSHSTKGPCTYYITHKGWRRGTAFVIFCYVGWGVVESSLYNTFWLLIRQQFVAISGRRIGWT